MVPIIRGVTNVDFGYVGVVSHTLYKHSTILVESSVKINYIRRLNRVIVQNTSLVTNACLNLPLLLQITRILPDNAPVAKSDQYYTVELNYCQIWQD